MIWKRLTAKRLAETKEHFASSGYVMQWYAMASEVILTTLGPEWWKDNCTSASSDPDEFLKTNDLSDNGRYDHQDRIIKLGHMLYALRSSEGYASFTASLKSRDLGPTFFELSVADILLTNGYEVGFIATTGARGNDYDLLASRSGENLHIEAKSRRLHVILNSSTLSNALTTARKQLPRSGPGVIFVEIPVEWTMHNHAEEVVSQSISSLFRNTSRVNAVVVCWDRWIELETGRASATSFRQYNNPEPRASVDLGEIVKPIDGSTLLNPSSQSFKPSFW